MLGEHRVDRGKIERHRLGEPWKVQAKVGRADVDRRRGRVSAQREDLTQHRVERLARGGEVEAVDFGRVGEPAPDRGRPAVDHDRLPRPAVDEERGRLLGR
jgi:hypothetical protein